MHETRIDIALGLLDLRKKCTVTNTEELLSILMENPLQKLIDFTSLPDRGARKKSFQFREHEVPVSSEKLAQRGEHPSKNGERILEAKLFNRWCQSSEGQDVWDNLVAWQIPLFDNRKRDGWGDIDLLGLKAGFPVIVELKGGNNFSCTPLAALLEALSYALVIAKHWGEVKKELLARKLPNDLPKEVLPEQVCLVILAPEDYWKHWQEERGKFAKSVPHFNEFLKKMRDDYCFSVKLCCMDSEKSPTKIKTRKDMPQAGTDKIGYSSW